MRPKRSSAEAQLGLPEYRGHSRAEKIAFALLVLFVIAAMLGLFGDGPLSHVSASSADGQVHAEYERFNRRQAPQSLDITFPTLPGADTVELIIDGDYLRHVKITETFPEALEATHQQTGKLLYRTDGSGHDMTVRLHLKAEHAGWFDARLIAGPPGKQAEVHFKQLVYP